MSTAPHDAGEETVDLKPRAMPWGRFWWAAWRADVRVAGLSLAARGLLVELRGLTHEQESPLPSSVLELGRLSMFLRAPQEIVEEGLRELREAGILCAVEGGARLKLFEAEDRRVEAFAKGGRASWRAKSGNPPSPPMPSDQGQTNAEQEQDQDQSRRKQLRKRPPKVLPKLLEPEGFEEFWQVYPKKVAKDAARRAWQKLTPDPELQRRIRAAVEVQRKSKDWLKDGGQYIPHAATWINNKRWEDEARSIVLTASKPNGGF